MTDDLSPSSEPPTPALIGRYEIVRELGRGMMGVVYEARDPALGRTVALKTIRLAFATTPEQRLEFEERFFTEARVAARLSHPGIVVCHDVGKDADTGLLFIVLEHLKGQTLSEVIGARGAMPWREALEIAAKLAHALQHAHEGGVVHRDMKPANVMRLDNGDVKVMDFGIAKETARSQLTATGQVFGSPLYMSPEQALGKPVDARADIFALGMIACHLLLGHPPFSADSVPAILLQVVQAEPPTVSREVPGMPTAVDAVLARAMAKRPEDRYATARMMADDLGDVLAGRPARHASAVHRAPADRTVVSQKVTAVPATAAVARKPRMPAAVLTGGALLLAVLSVAVAAFVLALRSRDTGGALGSARVRVEDATPAAVGSATPAIADSDGAARVDVVFEHGLRSAAFRVWVDEDAVLDEPVSARVTKKIATVQVREGRFERTLVIPPGERQFRIEVAWDNESKAKTVSATLGPDTRRTLLVKVGRLRKNLTVEWN